MSLSLKDCCDLDNLLISLVLLPGGCVDLYMTSSDICMTGMSSICKAASWQLIGLLVVSAATVFAKESGIPCKPSI